MAEWHFRPKSPGETIREPIQGEFFASDAISDPGTALVREGIQNALDAGRPGEQVLVRIFLSGPADGIPASGVAPFFVEAWQHFQASGNGLRPDDLPSTASVCTFLVFEDFGTCGLEGDTQEAFRSKEGGKNHFYHFFRAEGQSDKGATDRGSWGIGKHVFLRASRISTVFGLTIRACDRRKMLMGKSVLKSHWLGNQYCQDGYFGILPPNGGQLVMPLTDGPALDSLARIFDLQRGNEPGLSLVIPWPDNDITDKAIIRSVLLDYFFPIIAGQLEVIVETPSFKTMLDASTMRAEVNRLDPAIAGDLRPLIALAEWARHLEDQQKTLIHRPNPDRGWKWSEDLLEADQLLSLRAAFSTGERIAIRVPVTVRKKSGPLDSFFDVFLVRDNAEQAGRPTFIREGIIVPRVNPPCTRGVRAVVVAEDGPVAAFLRTAENPSHTEWQHIRLKDDYRFGYKTDLEFIKRSVCEIVRLLTAAEKEEDTALLADFFSLPAEPEKEVVSTKHRKPGAKPGPETPAPEPPPCPRPPRFRIEKIANGFSILPGTAPPPAMLEIRMAYDVRRGNPISKYNKADFQVDRPPIRFAPDPCGLEIIEKNENRVLVAIKDSEFALHLVGFDERRQLYVRATPREATDGGSQD